MFNAVGLVARIDRKTALGLATKLVAHLEARGLDIFLEPELARHINRTENTVPLKKMKADLIAIVGGDGTILRTCLQIPKPEPPILAINMGVRGFLAEVNPEEGLDALDKCLEGRFTLEHYMKLASSVAGTRLPDALNEIFFTSHMPAKLLHVRISRDDESIAECRADGVVIASQVGSTGYSLSGGGPVLDPEVSAFVLTPICPLTKFHPVVFSAESTIRIELLKPKRGVVVIDGDYQMSIEPESPHITVKKSEYESSFVRFKGSFYNRLKGRLLFSRGEGF
ncbi:MAG: NAD(+)/NADH kinase [Candidatus Bathyarchaeota archaeon]|nr:MAG: NAD(+)/NADH kinase [Candidatus Bathyarchaeota archaeon]